MKRVNIQKDKTEPEQKNYAGSLTYIGSHTVSYTHLDVYKRQVQLFLVECNIWCFVKIMNNLVYFVLLF